MAVMRFSPSLMIIERRSAPISTLSFANSKSSMRTTFWLKRAAFSAAVPHVELEGQDVVGVPRGRRPRLFALALADRGDALTRWQAGLSSRLEAERLYEPEKRPFWPHVTLARAKRGRTPRDVEVPGLPPRLRSPFEAGEVTLYRSTLKPQGAVYEALATGKKTPVH